MQHRHLFICLAGSLAALSTAGSALADERPAEPSNALTVAAPPPGPIAPTVQEITPPVVVKPAPAPAPTPPSPPPVQERPKRPQRWYGWQVLIVHVLSDAIVVGGLVATETGSSGGIVPMVLAPMVRGAASGILEAAHDDVPRAILFGAGSFVVPLVAGLGAAAALEGEAAEGGEEPWSAPALASGMLVGGAVMTAIEMTVAFEDKPNNVAVNLSPTHASVTVAF